MRRRRGGRNPGAVEGEEPVWMSLSDLMTGLLAVFMLATVALVYSLAQQQESLTEAMKDAEEAKALSDRFDEMLTDVSDRETRRAGMVWKIGSLLEQKGIPVQVDETRSIISVPVELLGFESGSSEIQKQYEANALILGEVLAEVLLVDDTYKALDTIFVEGHTDDVPMDSLHGGNWGLSANRAISLWRLWEDKLGTDLGALTGHSGQPLFSVSGYADTRPTRAVQKTAADRSANRRIDIRFTEHRLTEDEINVMREDSDRSNS